MTETGRTHYGLIFLFLACTSLLQVLLSPLIGTEAFALVPLDLEDAVVYFNYFNNVSDYYFPFLYAGYVALPQELFAWAVSALPLWFQLVSYPLTGVAIAVVMYGQIRAYLREQEVGGHAATAGALFACMSVQALLGPSYLTLSYSTWPCFIASSFFFVRMLFGGALCRVGSFVLFVFLSLCSPLSALFVPLFLAAAIWPGRLGIRPCALAGSGILLGYLLLVKAGAASDGSELSTFGEAVRQFEWRMHPKATLCFLMAGLALFSVLLRERRNWGRGVVLLYLAAGGTAAYFASDRFLRYHDFFGRYTVPMTVFSLVFALSAPCGLLVRVLGGVGAVLDFRESVRRALCGLLLCLVLAGGWYWYDVTSTWTFLSQGRGPVARTLPTELNTFSHGAWRLCLLPEPIPVADQYGTSTDPTFLPCGDSRIHLGEPLSLPF